MKLNQMNLVRSKKFKSNFSSNFEGCSKNPIIFQTDFEFQKNELEVEFNSKDSKF